MIPAARSGSRAVADKQGTDLLYSLIDEARGYDDAVILGRGDPDLATPQHIVAAAGDALRRDEQVKSPVAGLAELRSAVAERVRRVNKIEVDPATEVVVTNGGQEAVFLAVNAALGPLEEIIVPMPTYNSYIDAIRFSGGVGVDVITDAESGFCVSADSIRAAVTDRTECILMVSPGNPTASVIDPGTVREVVQIAAEHGLTIIADEIYDQFLYGDTEHLSPASLPDGRERTLTINSVSKTYAMTGWRVGWIVAPEHLAMRVVSLKAGVSGPTSVVAQEGAIAALNGPQDCVRDFRETYGRRRQIVLDAMDAMGFTYGRPEGGQFVFADIRSTGLDSVTLVQRVLDETHVLIYPGFAFGEEWKDFVRVTFLQPEEVLRGALERVKRVVHAL